MLIFVHVTYGPQYGNSSSVNNTNSDYKGYAFDTELLRIVPVAGTWRGDFLQFKPADVYYTDGTIVYYDCDNFAPGSDPTNYSATVYHYQRAGETVTSERVADCLYCGWEPTDTRTCKILIDSVTPTYDQATVLCSNFVGPLQYSLDGGQNRQASNVFTELSPAKYLVTVFDLGATIKGCKNTREFTISDAAPAGDVASVSALPTFCFAGNPMIVSVEAAVAFHSVVVQVWVETSHRSGNFSVAYESKRRSNSQGQVQLDVQDILRAQLANRLDVSSTWRPLTDAARNWFVRVADVLPQNGKPGTWVVSNNSLVVLGGLAAEPLLAGADYFGLARLARMFHTWQPLDKQVGPQHVEVLQYLQPDDEAYQVRVRWDDREGEAMTTDALNPPALPPVTTPQNAVVPPPLDPAQKVRFLQFMLDVSKFTMAGKLVVEIVLKGPAQNINVALPICYPRVLYVATTNTPRQLIYENSLGGYDTLAFFGKITGKFTTDSQQVSAYLNNSVASATTRITKSWPGAPSTSSYTLSTGWLSPEWLEYLPEVIQPGREVYEYVNGQLRPVVITTKEIVTYQENESMAAAVLEYKPALVNEFYTDYARNTNQRPTVGIGW